MGEAPVAHQGAGPTAAEPGWRFEDGEEHQVVALVEIGVAAVSGGIELAREGGAAARVVTGGDACEVQVEEVARQRLALIVEGMAPGVGGLELMARAAIARHCRQGIVAGGALRGAIGDVRQVGIVTPGGNAGKWPVHQIGGDEAAAEGSQPIHLHHPAITKAPLDAVEIALRVAGGETGVKHGQAREVGGDGFERRSGQHLRNGLQVIEAAGSQGDRRQGEGVVAQVLPEVVEGAVVEDAVRGAQQRAAGTRGIEGDADASGEIVVVGRKQLLVAAGRCNQGRSGQPRGQIAAGAEFHQRVLDGAGIGGGAVPFIAQAVVQGEARCGAEGVLREGGELAVRIAAVVAGLAQRRKGRAVE